MQVDPIEPTLKPTFTFTFKPTSKPTFTPMPGTKRLKLIHDKPLAKNAFNFTSLCYLKALCYAWAEVLYTLGCGLVPSLLRLPGKAVQVHPRSTPG